MLFRIQEQGDFQYLLKNGMDFSSFLAQEDQEAEEEDANESKTEIRPCADLMKRLRRRTDSYVSDNTSILSEVSAMKELPSTQSKLPENDDQMTGSKQDQEKETQATGSVTGMTYLNYFRAGTNTCAVAFMVVSAPSFSSFRKSKGV